MKKRGKLQTEEKERENPRRKNREDKRKQRTRAKEKERKEINTLKRPYTKQTLRQPLEETWCVA